MRFLLVVKQSRNALTFLDTLDALVERGHTVTLAVQERDAGRNEALAAGRDPQRFSVVPCPDARMDVWADTSELIRRVRDYVHYLQPAMAGAAKLRARVFQKLRQDLALGPDADRIARGMTAFPPEQVARLESALRVAEHGVPSDPLFDRFLDAHRPDVLMVSPLVHFGPGQADLVASARRAGVPVWMLLYSWDNLSTKGCLHRWPDRMFVWNEQQRREAQQLHGFPPDRAIVAGAPRFDAFFSLTPGLTRAGFLEPLGLDPARPTLLYVASSRLVSAGELAFIRKWLAALRSSPFEPLRRCNVLVRPHPDIPLLPPEMPFARHRWPGLPSLDGWVARPFDDPNALVLRTSFNTPHGLYESIVHSDAVVGLNTTAELEAGIVGRPVFTILADEQDADGQSSTVHFHYLTRAQGGFVSVAAGFADHVAQLGAALSAPPDPAPIRAFIESFLRPHGIDRPVSPLFADLLIATATSAEAPAREAQPSIDVVGAGPAPAALPERPVLPVAHSDGGLHVYATAAAERLASNNMLRLDRGTVDWVQREVSIGDVLYDVGAGLGGISLIAAKECGASVVAFEAGYAAFAQLCDNVLLNGCEAAVIPVPLALADDDGLAELKYPLGREGEQRYRVGRSGWRPRPVQSNRGYAQPACLVTLDNAIRRFRLPLPTHLRLSPFVAARPVLEGARETLLSRALRSLCLHVPADDEAAVVAWLAALGWAAAARRERTGDVQLVLARGVHAGDAPSPPRRSVELT